MLQFAVAGPVVRGLAWLIDATIRTTILILIFYVVGLPTTGSESLSASVGLFLIAQFLLNWFYNTTFEAATGTTPGKRLFGLWVVHDNATPITVSGAVIRNFLRAIDSLPFFNMTGLVAMLIDNRFRRLGDLAAGTLVIYREKAKEKINFDYDVGLAPPDWLTQDEKQAIVEFAERSQSLSDERQLELAMLLEHLLDESASQNPAHTLKCWAKWILTGQAHANPTSV